MNLFSAENLSKSFGEQVLFENLTFGLARGDKVALVARNGSGKTTLLRILMGKMGADEGEFTYRKGTRLAFLEQMPELDSSRTIEELILEVSQEVAARTEHVDEEEYNRRLKQMLDRFRITDISRNIGKLSGGEQKRVALAMVLLDEPDFLIMDEPTNHLDIEMIQWLEDYLARARLTLLMVTHDRYFLDRVCNRIIEMEGGDLYHYQGNYSYFLEKRAEREELRRVSADKASQLMKKELEWLRRMPKARTTKSKSRIDAFDGIRERARLDAGPGELNLSVKSPRLGGKILDLEGISKAYGEQKILEGFSYKFQKGERVGVIGRNGSGKTTMLELLTGNLSADDGEIDIGETIQMAYYRQMPLSWDPEMKVIDAVKEIAEVVKMENGSTISASKFLEHFLFPPSDQYKRIAKLSGGELRRLNLLTVLIRNPNFLLLDEPTNDLDLFALNKLEEFLLGFKGCLVVVSHDRYFLDKLSDHLFVFQGEGAVRDFYGSCSQYYYEQQSQQKSSRPKTIGLKAEAKKSAGVKTRLSYKEQMEYDRLEPEIEELEKEKEVLEQELNKGTLAYEELEKKSKRVAEIISLVEKKMERWLELEQYVK